MTKILQISAFYAGHGGGIEIVADRLARKIASDGVHVTWMAGLDPDKPLPAQTDRLAFVPARYWDPFEARFGLPCPFWGPDAIAQLWRQVGRADVVHLHDALYFPCIVAMVFSKLQRKPVVLTQHIGDLPLQSRLLRALLSHMNRIVAAWMLGTSNQVVFIADQVRSYFNSFARYHHPPVLVHNGVDHEIYRPADSRVPSTELKLLFVGRFVAKKGVQHLRDCLDLPGIRWTFVGKGPLSPLNWRDLPDNVKVVESLPSGAIVPYYQQADLLVLPSHGEGFPLVIQEALACGTPVLVGAEVEAACPNRDPACVYGVDVLGSNASLNVRDAIRVLTSDRERLEHARPHAVNLAAQWSWDACAHAYLEIYARLCADQGNA